MIQNRRNLIFALFLPIFALGVLTAYKKYVLSFGTEVTLGISGYDPRDLLSGHYLVYRIDYGVEGVCVEAQGKQEAFVCLEPKSFSYFKPENCSKLIQGICNYGRFEAGIEKFYVPQSDALHLEEKIRRQSASIVLSLSRTGQAQVKNLLIGGETWKTQ